MSTQTLSSPSTLKREESPPTLRPLGVGLSMLFFGAPATVMFASFHVLHPWLQSLGHDELTSFLVSLGLLMAFLFFAALLAYKLEGYPMTWGAFAGRMRLPRLRWQDVLWGLGIFAIGGVALGPLSGLILTLIQKGWMPLPSNLPAIADPRVSFLPEMLARSAGGVIHGRWEIAVIYLLVFFFNVVGEEL